jgi:hypothetical protein
MVENGYTEYYTAAALQRGQIIALFDILEVSFPINKQ